MFEAIARELRETRLFGDDSDSLVKDLDAIEDYVNLIVDFWEKQGAEVRRGVQAGAAARGVHGIVKYAAFQDGVVIRRQRVTRSMHKHLFKLVERTERIA